MRPFRPRHTGADQAAYTLTATVPDSPSKTRKKSRSMIKYPAAKLEIMKITAPR
ncbi:hypothetical protein I551_8331 [Mycobacterium ulcerans str. Harvey]|uniref:Uncharacterized protein n=1 Tax=Mycobacterium ulcerans str. Harvey TaxID=1299332 RepID=A0ABN0QKS0_MYCUL|nr:hypothetical protein I551_8331 [Mycobacterium ulcerans str. Harvey]